MSKEYRFRFKTYNGIVDEIVVGGEDEAKAAALARGYIKRRYGVDVNIELVEEKNKEEKENV